MHRCGCAVSFGAAPSAHTVRPLDATTPRQMRTCLSPLVCPLCRSCFTLFFFLCCSRLSSVPSSLSLSLCLCVSACYLRGGLSSCAAPRARVCGVGVLLVFSLFLMCAQLERALSLTASSLFLSLRVMRHAGTLRPLRWASLFSWGGGYEGRFWHVMGCALSALTPHLPVGSRQAHVCRRWCSF